MAAPAYFSEKRYSYHVYDWTTPVFTDYQTADPQTEFERRVQHLHASAYAQLRKEEYGLALDAFQQLQNLILTTVHPTLPIDSHRRSGFAFPYDASMVDAFVTKTARELQLMATQPVKFPDAVVTSLTLPAAVQKNLDGFSGTGVATAARSKLSLQLEQAQSAADRGEWGTAQKLYSAALGAVPATEPETRASLMHDLAIVGEKAGVARAQLVTNLTESAQLFETAKNFEANVKVLEDLAGLQQRNGDATAAATTIRTANSVIERNRLFNVVTRTTTLDVARVGRVVTTTIPILGTSPSAAAAAPAPAPAPPLAAGAVTAQIAESPALLGNKYWTSAAVEKTFRVSPTAPAIALTGDVKTNVSKYLQTIADTDDLSILHVYNLTHQEIVAYIPHMYFFTVPMAMGDCLAGMGNFTDAENQYRATLVYPFINKKYEIVKLWNKLAAVYLELGDQAYRNAKDNIPAYVTARGFYERIIRTNKTLDAASPLYQDAKFAGMKTRVQAFITANLAANFADNPTVLSLVMEANLKLSQIQQGLNFFGFAPDYAPPFSFEYLQTTARYFSQTASQMEARYIQFKSAAETETLQREQLDQQAEVARQTVVLEQRGLAEAQAGVNTAQANLNYATVQVTNATQARDQFAAVRDELLEYAELEAWANASNVDRDDQVHLTISGYSYYNTEDTRRNVVVKELAGQRTRVTHELEAARLNREVAAANAYRGVAQAQVAQAQARVAVAQQRIAIAQLQQRNAEENRDFMDLKEFSARLWYDLAREAKRITGRYLDMATEIAFLMERAYNAETERNLNVVRFDYRYTSAGNLLGADQLTLDIDSFTFDHVTTVRTKKAPVKRVISLADNFPMAFQGLKSTGTCNFQTQLANFDRQAPGMYLCKTRNVELIFVGVANATLAGTLRNGGVSAFRRPNGAIIQRSYPADVMPLSAYETRQDALAFRFNPNELRLFENNGIETQWQIDLPRGANDFNYQDILDVQLVLYYDGFFSPTLETQVKAALPVTGSGARAISLRMSYPDELFYLKSQGEAQVELDAALFPFSQQLQNRTRLSLRASGAAAPNLRLRLTSRNHGTEVLVTADANGLVAGNVAGDPLGVFLNEAMLDKWTVRILASDNPALVQAGRLNLNGLSDIMLYFEYGFRYR